MKVARAAIKTKTDLNTSPAASFAFSVSQHSKRTKPVHTKVKDDSTFVVRLKVISLLTN